MEKNLISHFIQGDNDIAQDDVLGSIFFQAPDEVERCNFSFCWYISKFQRVTLVHQVTQHLIEFMTGSALTVGGTDAVVK